MTLTREAFEAAWRSPTRPPEPDYGHPRERRRMPLPVLRDDASAWFGFLPARRGR